MHCPLAKRNQGVLEHIAGSTEDIHRIRHVTGNSLGQRTEDRAQPLIRIDRHRIDDRLPGGIEGGHLRREGPKRAGIVRSRSIIQRTEAESSAPTRRERLIAQRRLEYPRRPQLCPWLGEDMVAIAKDILHGATEIRHFYFVVAVEHLPTHEVGYVRLRREQPLLHRRVPTAAAATAAEHITEQGRG